MKPAYSTTRWLSQRWSTQALRRLSESDIQHMQRQVDAVVAENQALYESAKAAQDQARHRWREMYPRRQFPSELRRRPDPPPKLADQWQRLLKRRKEAIRRVEREQDEKRYTFMTRMTEGRYNAMLRREKAIRQLINAYAAKHGIGLTERAIDMRLAELFEHLPERIESHE